MGHVPSQMTHCISHDRISIAYRTAGRRAGALTSSRPDRRVPLLKALQCTTVRCWVWLLLLILLLSSIHCPSSPWELRHNCNAWQNAVTRTLFRGVFSSVPFLPFLPPFFLCPLSLPRLEVDLAPQIQLRDLGEHCQLPRRGRTTICSYPTGHVPWALNILKCACGWAPPQTHFCILAMQLFLTVCYWVVAPKFYVIFLHFNTQNTLQVTALTTSSCKGGSRSCSWGAIPSFLTPPLLPFPSPPPPFSFPSPPFPHLSRTSPPLS